MTSAFAVLAVLLGALYLFLGTYFLANLDWFADLERANMHLTASIFVAIGTMSILSASGLFRRFNIQAILFLLVFGASWLAEAGIRSSGSSTPSAALEFSALS